MHVLLMAYAEWGLAALEASRECADQVSLVTYASSSIPKRPPFWLALDDYCLERGIAVYRESWPPNYEWADRVVADVAISSNWRHLIPATVLERFPVGCFNVHRSLLPKYRGAAPINWAIANGESQTGVTIHRTSAELDAGDIVYQEPFPIGATETATSVFLRSDAVVRRLVRRLLADLERRALHSAPQGPGDGRIYRSPTRSDLRVDWAWSARQVFNLIRAQSPPFENAYTDVDDTDVLIETASIAAQGEAQGRPGLVFSSLADGRVCVVCGRGQTDREVLLVGAARLRGAANPGPPSSVLPVGRVLGSDQCLHRA